MNQCSPESLLLYGITKRQETHRWTSPRCFIYLSLVICLKHKCKHPMHTVWKSLLHPLWLVIKATRPSTGWLWIHLGPTIAGKGVSVTPKLLADVSYGLLLKSNQFCRWSDYINIQNSRLFPPCVLREIPRNCKFNPFHLAKLRQNEKNQQTETITSSVRTVVGIHQHTKFRANISMRSPGNTRKPQIWSLSLGQSDAPRR